MRAKMRIVLSTALLGIMLVVTGCTEVLPTGDKTSPGDGDGIGTSPSVKGQLEEPGGLPPQCTQNGPVVGTPGFIVLVVCPKT